MRSDIQFSLFPARLAGGIAGACGGLSLLLALIGLHAMVAQNVIQRNQEFAIRRAIGANGFDIVRLVARQGLFVTGVGLLIGLPLALLAGQALRGLLYGLPPTDPVSLVIVSTLLLGVLVWSAWGPARRALRADPVQALRSL